MAGTLNLTPDQLVGGFGGVDPISGPGYYITSPTVFGGAVLGESKTASQPQQGQPTDNGAAQRAQAAQAAQQAQQVNGYYDTLSGNVNNQIGRLGTQESIGSQNIQDGYNSAFNTLQTGKNQATQDYQTTKANDLRDNVSARGQIAFNTGQQTNALQRLLGSHGFGNSLAAEKGVPYLTARAGTEQTSHVTDAFGRNQQALDTGYNDYLGGVKSSEDDLNHKRDTQQNQLKSTIASRKSDLLAQLANIAQQRVSARGGSLAQAQAASQPFQDQINGLGNQIDQLGREYASPVFQTNAPAYQAPELSKYDFQPQAAATLGNQAGGVSSNISPFVNVLLNSQNDRKNLNNVGF